MTKFTCPICDNSFASEREFAVCNGVNVQADERGRPIDRDGRLVLNGEPLLLLGMNGEPVPELVTCLDCAHAWMDAAPFTLACPRCAGEAHGPDGPRGVRAKARPMKGVHSHAPAIMLADRPRRRKGAGLAAGLLLVPLGLAQTLLLSALSDFMEKEVWNDWWRAVAPAAKPTSVYIALFTAAPADSGGGTEVSTTGTAYARQGVVRSPTASARWADPGATSGLTDNLDAITWAVATGNYGTVTSVGVLDALTVGNLWMYGNLTTAKAVNTDDTAKFAVGALDLSIA